MAIVLLCSTQLIKLPSIQFRSSLSQLKHVKYMVVGSFAIQDETTEAITEAMGTLRLWNESWNPVCFMVDNCIKEIQCLEHLFPSNHILIHISYIQASFIIYSMMHREKRIVLWKFFRDFGASSILLSFSDSLILNKNENARFFISSQVFKGLTLKIL